MMKDTKFEKELVERLEAHYGTDYENQIRDIEKSPKSIYEIFEGSNKSRLHFLIEAFTNRGTAKQLIQRLAPTAAIQYQPHQCMIL